MLFKNISSFRSTHSCGVGFLALFVMILAFGASAQVYKWTDEKGHIHYGQQPPETAKSAKQVDLSATSVMTESGSRVSEMETAAPPASSVRTASDNAKESTPASPPPLIPSSLLPPSNPPTAAKPEQPAQPDIVEVVAQGMGTDANVALLNAYSNAVQQALGQYVDAETLVQNDTIVRDKILTYSKGFIQEATKVNESQANGLFQVTIRAKVKRQQLLEQAKASNISVKAVEGVSLHAKVMSEIKQEQNASALLEKALLPFIGTDLMRAELVGEPKAVKEEQGNITLSYPISLFIDENSYKKAANELTTILDKIASDKKEFTMQYDSERRENYPEIYERQTRQTPCIQILTWKDKSLTHSKWLSYSLPENLVPKQLTSKLDKLSGAPKDPLMIELNLLGTNEETIAMGSVSPGTGSDFLNNTYLVNEFLTSIRKKSECFIIRPYFSSNIAYPKIQGNLIVKADQQDLANIKSAKLEVKR